MTDIFNDYTDRYSEEQLSELASFFDQKDITNDVKQTLQQALDSGLSFDDIKQQLGNYSQQLNNIANIDISDYLKFPSVDISLSNVLSSAKNAISIDLSSISSQVSVLLSPLSIPDYDISAIMLSAKQMIDEIKQQAVKAIDQSVEKIKTSVTTIMTGINGWMDTSVSSINVSKMGASMSGMLSKVTSVIGKLPLPISIPGLDSITSLVGQLSTMSIPSIPTQQQMTDMITKIYENKQLLGSNFDMSSIKSVDQLTQISQKVDSLK